MEPNGGHHAALATPPVRAALATPPEVAAHLQIPEPTLAQWRYRGTGPASLRVGRHVRYRWADVERWEDEQTSKGAA
ncbi:MAG: helix-turn-helix transcriptional regulator [Acidimicrobiales bacterium]